VDILGLEGQAVDQLRRLVATGLAFGSIWILFLGVYRFLPARWIPWRTALIAATFAAVLHELLKLAFGWYATDVANYRTTYGNLVTVAVLLLWIYYESLVFILGGEVAQVWTMRRARRVRTRSALFGSGGPSVAHAGSAEPTKEPPDHP
jgi:membrane protein